MLGTSESFTRRTSLDGLRGILAVMVVGFHIGLPFLDQGYCGVDGFFVLSGFVISSLIIREVHSTPQRTINYIRFYARRAKRLLPASLVVIAVTAVCFRVVGSDRLMQRLQGSLLSAVGFSENVYLIAKAADYFSFDTNESPVMHYWSLAVEEQFYFVFPLAFTFFLRCVPNPKYRLLVLLATIGILIAYQHTLQNLVQESYMYFGTQFRLYQLLAGVLLGVLFFHWEAGAHSQTMKQIGNASAGVGFLTMLLISTSLFTTSSYVVGLISTWSSIMLICGLEFDRRSWVATLLDSPTLQFLGKHSYAIYLWHYPIIVLLKLLNWRIFTEDPAYSDLMIIASILVLSWLSGRFVEGPIKSIKASDNMVVLVAIGAVLCTLSIVSTTTSLRVEESAVCPVVPLDHQPIPVPHENQENEEQKERSPEVAPTLGLSLTPTEAEGQVDPTYFVVGDSFAEEWHEAVQRLDRETPLSIKGFSMPACPWMLNTTVGGRDCNAREYYFEKVMAHPGPRVITLISFSIYQHILWAGDHYSNPVDADWGDFMEARVQETFKYLFEEEKDNYAVILQAHFVRPVDIGPCLMRYSAEVCDRETYQVTPLPDHTVFGFAFHRLQNILERVGAPYIEQGRLAFTSIDEIVAPTGTIHALSGGIEVFQDDYHLSRKWAEANPFVLTKALEPYIHSYPAPIEQ